MKSEAFEAVIRPAMARVRSASLRVCTCRFPAERLVAVFISVKDTGSPGTSVARIPKRQGALIISSNFRFTTEFTLFCEVSCRKPPCVKRIRGADVTLTLFCEVFHNPQDREGWPDQARFAASLNGMTRCHRSSTWVSACRSETSVDSTQRRRDSGQACADLSARGQPASFTTLMTPQASREPPAQPFFKSESSSL